MARRVSPSPKSREPAARGGRLHRILRTIGKEIREVIPPTIFFLVMFHIAAFLRALNEESYGITPVSTATATIGALLVGKAILVANKLPLTNRYSDHPLAISVLWKTVIFGALALLFQLLEEWIPLVAKYHSFSGALTRLYDETVWARFWANHVIFLIFLVIYCCAIELIDVFGARTVRRLFFGPGPRPEHLDVAVRAGRQRRSE